MKLEKLAAMSEIVGSIAIVITLVYLVGQTREMANQTSQMAAQTEQANRAVTSQTRWNISEGIVEFLVNMGSDPDLASLWSRGTAGEELEPLEGEQFRALLTGFLRYLEGVHYQYRNGLYDEVEFRAQREQLRFLFGTPGYQNYWCDPERPFIFSPEFTDEIDRLAVCSDTARR